MTRRIPKTLKKKLEASLKNLTPREAGRLALIYLHEAFKADKESHEYPPRNELYEAWEVRVAAAYKVGVEEGNRATALFNGFLFLDSLVLAANDFAEREFYRIAYLTLVAASQIESQLDKDLFGEVARRVSDNIKNQTPFPVSHEDFKRMTEKAGRFNFEIDENVVDEVMTSWAADQGFNLMSREAALVIVKEENREELQSLAEGAHNGEGNEEEFKSKFWRAFFESPAGEAWAKKVFQGDDEAREEWVANCDARGGWAGAGLTAKVWEEKKKEVADQIEGLIAAGKIEAVMAASLTDCFDSIRIIDGAIPAWAALRATWRGWLVDHDFLIEPTAKIDAESLRGVMAIYSIDGDLEGDDLVNVVAEFVADCRAKPWGDGLATEVDLGRLARFLIALPTPLTDDEGEALQLGRVNFEAFVAADGGDGLDREEPFRVTTAQNVKAVAADLGLTADFADEVFDQDYLITDFYYPTDTPEDRRDDLARIMGMINSLEVMGSPYAYNRRKSSDSSGVDFMARLEEWVKLLGQAFGEAATFRHTFEVIADEYFDGLPVLLPYNEEKFATTEALVQYTEDRLTKWLARIEGDPWKVDTSTLKLVKDPVDEEKVKNSLFLIFGYTTRMSGLDNRGQKTEINLGDGVDPRKTPPKPEAKKTTTPVSVEVEGEVEA